MSETRSWIKIPLFLSSYFPLWLIFLGVLFIDPKYQILVKPPAENQLVVGAAITFAIMIIASLSILRAQLLQVERGNNPRPITIKDKEDITSGYILYIATYVVPFVSDNFLEYHRIYMLVVMMATIGAMYIRGNLFHINPALNLFGYRLYKVQDTHDNKLLILSRRDEIEDSVDGNILSNTIFIDTKKK